MDGGWIKRSGVALLAIALITCNDKSTPSPIDDLPLDSDGDGLADGDDPTPEGSNLNLLNGTNTGGHARVVEIWSLRDMPAMDASVLEDGEDVYNNDLDAGCEATWTPQGTLCDEGAHAHSKTANYKQTASGATWSATGGDTTGILVVDACSDAGCVAIDFVEARVFQMFSDGKTTQVRISVHGELGDTAPTFDDAGWLTVTGFADIGAGAVADEAPGTVVTDPTTISVTPTQVTRYLKIEAKNDGTHGDSSWTELRSVKLFGAPAI
jgi:hypothetical protein